MPWTIWDHALAALMTFIFSGALCRTDVKSMYTGRIKRNLYQSISHFFTFNLLWSVKFAAIYLRSFNKMTELDKSIFKLDVSYTVFVGFIGAMTTIVAGFFIDPPLSVFVGSMPFLTMRKFFRARYVSARDAIRRRVG